MPSRLDSAPRVRYATRAWVTILPADKLRMPSGSRICMVTIKVIIVITTHNGRCFGVLEPNGVRNLAKTDRQIVGLNVTNLSVFVDPFVLGSVGK